MLVLKNQFKIVVPLFGAAFNAEANKDTTILFWFMSLSTAQSPVEKKVEFKDFARLGVIFQYFSRHI